jgi:uncharacterized phage protein (TIGR02218 family)
MQVETQYHTLVKISQNSEVILAMSDFDSNLEVDNIIYTPNKTIHIENIQSNAELNPQSTTLTFIPTNSEKDIIIKNINLLIQVFIIKIDENKKTKVILKQGSIGNIGIEGNKIMIEIKSTTETLANKINHRYSSNCRANFGDSQCKIDPEKYTIKKILVKDIIDNELVIDMESAEIPKTLSKLDKKTIEMIAVNADVKLQNQIKIGEIIKLKGNKLLLGKLSERLKIKPGETISITFRCNKSFKSCHDIFQNNKNFRGEPQLLNS